jgi:hypothetical protein
MTHLPGYFLMFLYFVRIAVCPTFAPQQQDVVPPKPPH